MNEEGIIVKFQVLETVDCTEKDHDEPITITALRQGAVGTITVEKNDEILYRWIRDDPQSCKESVKE